MTLKNINVLKVTRVPWTLDGGPTGASGTPLLFHLFSQAGTWGAIVPKEGGSPPQPDFRCESHGGGQVVVVPRAARGADGAGPCAGRGGAAGAPAWSGGARSGCADRRAPPPTHPAPPCVYVETKMAAAVTALPVRPRTVSH